MSVPSAQAMSSEVAHWATAAASLTASPSPLCSCPCSSLAVEEGSAVNWDPGPGPASTPCKGKASKQKQEGRPSGAAVSCAPSAAPSASRLAAARFVGVGKGGTLQGQGLGAQGAHEGGRKRRTGEKTSGMGAWRRFQKRIFPSMPVISSMCAQLGGDRERLKHSTLSCAVLGLRFSVRG